MKLGHKGMILVAVPLVCELIFIGTLSCLLQQVEYERQREQRAQQIAAHMNKLLRALIYAGAMTSGDALSRRKLRLMRGSDPLDEAPQEFQDLKNLVKDNPEQLVKVEEIEKLVYEGVKTLEDIRKLTGDGQAFQAIFDMKHFSALVTKVGAKIDIVIHDAEIIEKDETISQEQTRKIVQQMLLVALLIHALVAVGLAVYFNRGTTRRLAVVVDNTMRLAASKPLNPPLDGNDEIAYLDKVFRDTAQALADSEKYKRELTAMVTHDLRSPLAAVQAVLELLSMGVYGEQTSEAVEHLGLAENNVNRVLRLINDLLDIEKMKAGKLTLHIEPTPLADVVKRSVEAVKTLAEKKHLRIVVPDKSAIVDVDPGRLVQVLINLLSNAVKYSSEEGVVYVEIEDISDDEVEVRVTDTGCGIAPEYHQAVFEKFEQATPAPMEIGNSKGTGLGLAICKAIIEQHGGKIGVRSDLGAGATFWFRLLKSHQNSGMKVAELSGELQ